MRKIIYLPVLNLEKNWDKYRELITDYQTEVNDWRECFLEWKQADLIDENGNYHLNLQLNLYPTKWHEKNAWKDGFVQYRWPYKNDEKEIENCIAEFVYEAIQTLNKPELTKDEIQALIALEQEVNKQAETIEQKQPLTRWEKIKEYGTKFFKRKA